MSIQQKLLLAFGWACAGGAAVFAVLCAIIPTGGRIQIVGDSFAILPPEVT